jgi:hypothetical protein
MEKEIKKKITWILLSFAINFIAILFLFMKFFYPYHILIAFIIYTTGWIPFILAFFGGKSKLKNYIAKYKLTIIISIISLIFLWITLSLFPATNFEILLSDKIQLEEKINKELTYLSIYMDKLKESEISLLNELEGINVNNISSKEKQLLLEKWAEYLRYIIILDKIQEENKFFYQINYLKYKELNEKSFILAYSPFMAKHISAFNVISKTEKIEFLKNILNEENSKLEIPKNSHLMISNIIADPAKIIRSNAGYAYISTIEQKEIASLKEETINNHKEMLKHTTSIKYASFKFKTALNFFEKNTFKTWFPLQKNVAEWMGDTKIPLRHKTLANKEDIEHIKSILEPGDILIQRRNWYLSNAGLPGFWKHTAIYISNLTELDSYFGNINGIPVSTHIKENYPELYITLKDGNLRTIEAESEGVISFKIEKSLELDYLGVLRPTTSKEEKLNSLLTAFEHYGKKYDFDFDFATDNELVCSEVYYKAYPEMGHKLRIVSGRLVLSSNDIVEDFDNSYGKKNQKLDFVYFLDAIEKEEKTFSGDLNSFRKSWKRSGTDIWFIKNTTI